MFSLSIPSPRLPLRRPWGGRRIASRIGDIFHHLWCHKRPPIASGGSGWKDTTGPGCWSAGIFLVDSLKFGTDFRLNHTWKNGRSAFAFLGTGWAIFLGDVCTSSKFFHLSLYREGRTKVQRPYLCLTVTHVRLSKNRVIQIHWSLCFTSETRHRKSQCTPHSGLEKRPLDFLTQPERRLKRGNHRTKMTTPNLPSGKATWIFMVFPRKWSINMDFPWYSILILVYSGG